MYLIVSSPNIFCHDINTPVLYSGIEGLGVIIFFISKAISSSIFIMWGVGNSRMKLAILLLSTPASNMHRLFSLTKLTAITMTFKD